MIERLLISGCVSLSCLKKLTVVFILGRQKLSLVKELLSTQIQKYIHGRSVNRHVISRIIYVFAVFYSKDMAN